MSSAESRRIAAVGSLGRLAYALGLLLAPDGMSAWRLAPEHSSAYARMTTRAFGAVHVNVAVATLRAAVKEANLAQMLALNIGCDAGDLLATVMERRHGLPRIALVGSAAVQSAGMTAWAYALSRSRKAI